MLVARHAWINSATSWLCLSFFVLCFVLPSGYSIGPAALLLTSLLVIIRNPAALSSNLKSAALITVAFSSYFITGLVTIYEHGDALRELDRPSRFFAALLIIPILMRYPPSQLFVWIGASLGAIVAASSALHDLLVENLARATGNTQAIQFGNISIAFGLISLCGLTLQRSVTSHRNIIILLSLLGFMSGVIASVLSGSRGGWLAILLVPYILTASSLSLKKISRPYQLLTLSCLVVAALPLHQLLYPTLETRVAKAHQELNLYHQTGNASTSIGARLELWKAAVIIGVEKPVLGWGESGAQHRKTELADQGRVSPDILKFEHSHNDYLNAFEKRGLAGLAAVLLLYGLPFLAFTQCNHSQSSNFGRVGGIVTCLSFATFSLSQGFLEHNSGVLVYAFLIILFWSICQKKWLEVS